MQLSRIVLGIGILSLVPLLAQDERVLDPALDPVPPLILRSYLLRIANGQLAARKQQIALIRTPEQFEKHRVYVRETILRAIGGLPAERMPLNVQKVGVLNRGDYRVEKVIYESLPRFYVTANLYIPQAGRPPYAAVLLPQGHSDLGKAEFSNQVLAISLAKLGFVVLAYDPIGQGERRIFWDPDLGDSKVGITTEEHQMVGAQSILAGESVLRYRVWDGMRGIDLLQSLPEVDAKRIGVTGCSGGGLVTAYLAALDDRVRTAAPACYITSWEDQLGNADTTCSGPQDAENNFPDHLLDGIDYADLVMLMAPKPYLICSMALDACRIRGSYEAYGEARKTYALLNAEDRLGYHIAPGRHGLYPATREAIYAWMKRWLQGEPAGTVREPSVQVEAREDLYCTPTGQVSTSLGGETASTCNIRRFSKMSPPRPRIQRAEDLERLRVRLKDEVLRLTRYTKSEGPLNICDRGVRQREGYHIERLLYDAGGRTIPALLCIPEAGRERRKAMLYVNQLGKSAAGEMDELARLGFTVLALDPSGVGETATNWGQVDPTSRMSLPWLFGQDKVTFLALMVGKPTVGLRMDDILRGLDVLREKKLLYDGRALAFAKGNLSVTLLHAAVVDSRIEGLVLDRGLVSYRSVATTPVHRQIFDVILPGVLAKYDLVDLVAALAPRPVWIADAAAPVGPVAQPLPLREVKAAYRFASDAYAAVGAASSLKILRRAQVMGGVTGIAESFPELR